MIPANSATRMCLVLWATSWTSNDMDISGGNIQKVYRTNLKANSVVDENWTRSQADYSFMWDFCSIGGNKTKVITKTQAGQLWAAHLS